MLILDEITSGWRRTIGGIHLLEKVNPDITVFAKGISNGYPMAAVLGKREIMDIAQKSFISSTYWTERIGPAAAIATINKLKKHNIPAYLCRIGDLIGKGWKELTGKHQLKIKIMNISPLITFRFDYEGQNAVLDTLFNQEMLKRGFLCSKSVYVSYAHTEEIVKIYLDNVDKVFEIVSKAISSNAYKFLKGPIIHSGFKRLT